MNRMKLRFLLLILLFPSALHAQTTWKDLRFGMSQADVTAKLAEQNIRVVPDGSNRLRSDNNFSMKLPELSKEFLFKVHTSFLEGKLNSILLVLDLDGMKSQSKTRFSPVVEIYSDQMFIADTMIEKYGLTTSKSSDCSDGPDRAFVPRGAWCRMQWNATGEAVYFLWSTNQQDPFLSIEYEAINQNL
jgi:hypothetical protein